MLQINDIGARIAANRQPIKAAIGRVVDSGWLVLGPEVRRFEAEFAAYLGVARCIGVANGTDAIELALRALGVVAGDRVATAANAGMYATTAILAIGAEPFFLDTDPVTRCIAPDEVERALAAGVRAVVATHLYGLAIPQIAIIAALCRARGVPLLEDCAQAHGASVAGRRAGSFGNAASFSFYPTKNLGALGDGGAVATNDLAAADKVERLRQYGWSAKYRAELPGARNSRLDELQAAVLAALLPGLDEANARRREIAAMYSKGIIHPRVVVPPHCGTGYVAHLYVVESDDRDGLRDHLRQNGIAADVHYPLPDHRQQVFDGRFAQVSLPVAERLAGAVLTLPCYPEMTDSEAQTVVHAINRWPTG